MHLAGPGAVTDVLGLEDAEVRCDAGGAQGIDVALVTGNRSRAARFNVMRQRAELSIWAISAPPPMVCNMDWHRERMSSQRHSTSVLRRTSRME